MKYPETSDYCFQPRHSESQEWQTLAFRHNTESCLCAVKSVWVKEGTQWTRSRDAKCFKSQHWDAYDLDLNGQTLKG